MKMKNKAKIGDKIAFDTEKGLYTVKACDERYLICTKPYNFKKTVFYSIVDLEKGIRGPNNLVFNSYDYKNQKDIDRCLKDLQKGKIEVSNRNKLDVVFTNIISNGNS